MKPLNVLSLFDGMSCGQIALSKLGIPVNYYAAEIDKYAIQVTKHNFPETTHLGDVSKWQDWDIDFSKIDLIIGGSPCQGFSYAGKQLAFEDPRSKLFFTFVDILNFIKEKNPNVKFLLENVKMKKDYLQVISEYLGVQPVCYNSSLVSAQRRIRYYWSNLPYPEIEDRGVLVKDILDTEIDETTIMGEGWQKWFKDNKDFQLSKQYSSVLSNDSKAITMTARQYASWNGNFVLMKQLGRGFNKGFEKPVSKTGTLTSNSWQHNNFVGLKFIGGFKSGRRVEGDAVISRNYREGSRVYDVEGKAAAITANSKGGLGGHSGLYGHVSEEDIFYRKLSVKECCRLQTVPDNYFEGSGVSNSQAYKMLGNGWTVDIIVEILKGIKTL